MAEITPTPSKSNDRNPLSPSQLSQGGCAQNFSFKQWPKYTQWTSIYCELKMSHVSMKSNARHGFLSTRKRQRKKCTPHDSDCLRLFILFLNPTTAYRHSSSQNGRIVDGKHNQTSKCFHSISGLQIPTRRLNRYSGECPTTRCMLATTPGHTTMLYKGMAWQCKRIRLRIHAYE
jgi:hypothetical protein